MDAFEHWQTIQQNRQRLLTKINNDQAPSARRIPTRRQAKSQRKSFVRLVRKSQPDCMLNMPVDKFHRPVPMLVGERDKRLFAVHDKRREAGWIRG